MKKAVVLKIQLYFVQSSVKKYFFLTHLETNKLTNWNLSKFIMIISHLPPPHESTNMKTPTYHSTSSSNSFSTHF